jgi:hypothetical protein
MVRTVIMGAIVDTLHLNANEIPLIQSRFRNCNVSNQSSTGCGIQKYRIIIVEEDLSNDEYYLFLIINGIARSSSSFLARIESDQSFVERMRAGASDASNA